MAYYPHPARDIENLTRLFREFITAHQEDRWCDGAAAKRQLNVQGVDVNLWRKDAHHDRENAGFLRRNA
jgi:hypothetical protein